MHHILKNCQRVTNMAQGLSAFCSSRGPSFCSQVARSDPKLLLYRIWCLLLASKDECLWHTYTYTFKMIINNVFKNVKNILNSNGEQKQKQHTNTHTHTWDPCSRNSKWRPVKAVCEICRGHTRRRRCYLKLISASEIHMVSNTREDLWLGRNTHWRVMESWWHHIITILKWLNDEWQ